MTKKPEAIRLFVDNLMSDAYGLPKEATSIELTEDSAVIRFNFRDVPHCPKCGTLPLKTCDVCGECRNCGKPCFGKIGIS